MKSTIFISNFYFNSHEQKKNRGCSICLAMFMLSGEVDLMSDLIRNPKLEYVDEFHCPIQDLELALRHELDLEFRSRITSEAKVAKT